MCETVDRTTFSATCLGTSRGRTAEQFPWKAAYTPLIPVSALFLEMPNRQAVRATLSARVRMLQDIDLPD